MKTAARSPTAELRNFITVYFISVVTLLQILHQCRARSGKKISAGVAAVSSYPSSPQASVILAMDRCKCQRPVA